MKEKIIKFIRVFIPEYKYNYLGYVYIPYDRGTEPYDICRNFLEFVDKQARPWWCPRWFLRFLHVYGNDNSIARVSNRKLHNLYGWIMNGIQITDIKTKWHESDIRIYGYFTREIDAKVIEVENKIFKYFNPALQK